MAKYCRQCADERGWPGKGDFAGLTKDGNMVTMAYVHCSGCGWIWVDPEGFCMGIICLPKLVQEGEKTHRPRPHYSPRVRRRLVRRWTLMLVSLIVVVAFMRMCVHAT